MKILGRTLVLLIIAAAVGLIVYPMFHKDAPPVVAQPSPSPSIDSQSPSPSPSPSPSDHYPVPSESPGASGAMNQAIPKLDDSDPNIKDALSEIFGKKQFESLFHLENIVRRIVVTTDGLTKKNQPTSELSPFQPIETKFMIAGKGDSLTINPANYRRYKPFVQLIENLDADKFADAYVHYYPLMQAAYQDLGLPGYFNDRLIKVIDLLLQTPAVQSPIKIKRAAVDRIYKLSDDSLESLPSGQKILIRMGGENQVLVKSKLRELRAKLVHLEK